MFNNYLCALDIGSSKIAGVVAEIKKKRIANIFFDVLASKGIKQGMVIDSIALVESVSRLLKNLKLKSGINIKFIYTNVSGLNITSKHSRAIIPLAERGNKVITLSDIRKVNEQARLLGSSIEEEIIYLAPFGYAIDSKSNILNPIGLYSHRLEVDLYLVCGKLSSIQALTRVINQAGCEIKYLFFSGIATSCAVFDKEFKKGASVLCDIGYDITELLYFKDGMLKGFKILPFGGEDLTRELVQGLNLPFDLAEDTKRSYASAGDSNQVKQDKEILVKINNIYKPIKQKLIIEIITAKTKSICSKIKDTVVHLAGRDHIDNFIVTGRTILLEGFLEILENSLDISCKVGRIVNPDIISKVNKDNNLSGQKYLIYTTALGIICQAFACEQPQSLLSTSYPTRNPLFRLINKVKEVYQEYF